MAITISGTTGIAGVNGSAGTPAVQGTDGNTGVFYPAADTVGVSTGGSERLRIDSSGNVGIGTSSPSGKLDVATDSNTTAYLTYTRNANAGSSAYAISGWGNNSSSNAGQVAVSSTANTGYGGGGDFIFLANTGDMTLRTTTAKPITFYTNSTLSASITSAGLFQFNSGYGSVATAYGCRAWVNFNGTGTVAIRASGNVTSITDNGTGDYTVNFTNAMPDANYAGVANATWESTAPNNLPLCGNSYGGAKSTTAFQVRVLNPSSQAAFDSPYINVAIFR